MIGSKVRITEVSPRDGLQSERDPIDTSVKADLVRRVQSTGVDEVEVSSFVSPKWVPQLGDAAEVFAMIANTKPDGVIYSALVPNERGLDAALQVNHAARQAHGVERLIEKVSVFTSASEGFSLKNTNATIEETIERFRPLIPRAREHGLMVRGYISCVVRCPFDGDIQTNSERRCRVAPARTRVSMRSTWEDTIGAATPELIEPVILEVVDRLGGEPTNRFGDPTLTLHLHDTFAHARDCVLRALELGVRSFDGSAGGLGGCPYASNGDDRAPGNIATLTLVDSIAGAGYETNIDRKALHSASVFASGLIA